MDQKLTFHILGGQPADAAACITAAGGRTWNDVMSAILKVWRHIRNPTTSVDAYLREEQFRKFHPDPILKDRDWGCFEESRPNKKKH